MKNNSFYVFLKKVFTCFYKSIILKKSTISKYFVEGGGKLSICEDDNKLDECDDVLYIQTLGDFTLKYKGIILSGEKVRSKQVWNLLEYIVANRYKDNSLYKLMDVLWGVDDIDAPANALKNLAYRLRNILEENLGIKASEYIISKRGSYSWNINSKYKIDVEILEELLKTANSKFMDIDEALKYYMKALSIYKGTFMAQSSHKEWTRPLSVYYQNLYMEAVEKASNILLKKFDYAKVEEICRIAISFDASIEINHANLIKSLIGLNNNKKALEHYNYITKYFYNEFGIKPSDIITKLYSDITDKKSGCENNISIMINDLKETNNINGTMQCNYETFKEICRLQARAASRSGKSIFIVLLTVNPKTSNSYFEKNLEDILEKIMQIICGFLRKDDVVSRCGRTQFVLMLSNITHENTVMVLNRLDKAISITTISKWIELNSQIEILDPIEIDVKDA